MPLRHVILGLAILLALTNAPAASAEEAAGSGRAEARRLVATMDRNRTLGRMLAQCPADVFRQATARRSADFTAQAIASRSCSTDPGACLAACTGGDGPACFGLARTVQRNAHLIPARYAQALFTMACARGIGAGCTNRGAGLRNADYEGDPLRRLRPQARESCQHRSFAIACGEGDAWGCAMLGQSYRLGEGTLRNVPAARAAYDKSCGISADFAACTFSRAGLRAMAEGSL